MERNYGGLEVTQTRLEGITVAEALAQEYPRSTRKVGFFSKKEIVLQETPSIATSPLHFGEIYLLHVTNEKDHLISLAREGGRSYLMRDDKVLLVEETNFMRIIWLGSDHERFLVHADKPHAEKLFLVSGDEVTPLIADAYSIRENFGRPLVYRVRKSAEQNESVIFFDREGNRKIPVIDAIKPKFVYHESSIGNFSSRYSIIASNQESDQTTLTIVDPEGNKIRELSIPKNIDTDKIEIQKVFGEIDNPDSFKILWRYGIWRSRNRNKQEIYLNSEILHSATSNIDFAANEDLTKIITVNETRGRTYISLNGEPIFDGMWGLDSIEDEMEDGIAICVLSQGHGEITRLFCITDSGNYFLDPFEGLRGINYSPEEKAYLAEVIMDDVVWSWKIPANASAQKVEMPRAKEEIPEEAKIGEKA